MRGQSLLDFSGEQNFLAGYFNKAEELFSFLRERGVLFSPRDYELLKSYYDADIPLSCILLGIRTAFFNASKADTQINSLSYCRYAIEAEIEAYWQEDRFTAGQAKEAPDDSAEKDRTFLDALILDLRKCASNMEKKRCWVVAGHLKEAAKELDKMNGVLCWEKLLEIEKSMESQIFKDLPETRRDEIRQQGKALCKKNNILISSLSREEKDSILINETRKYFKIPNFSGFGG